MPGLSIWIDSVIAVEGESQEEREFEQTAIEVEIESAIAKALHDHPMIPAGATVTAEYFADEDEDEGEH